MARITLLINNVRDRITLKAILEAKGNIIDNQKFDVIITDRYDIAKELSKNYPVIVLASVSQIPEAVELMKGGVFGYVFLPFQPDEANIMVERAIVYWRSAERKADRTNIKTLKEMEMEYIWKVYTECGFNKQKTAEVLGIGRNTLWRKLKEIKEKGKSLDASPRDSLEV